MISLMNQIGCLADSILMILFYNIFMERKKPFFIYSSLMVGMVFLYINLAATFLHHFYLSNPVILFCDLMMAILFYNGKIFSKMAIVISLHLVTVICELLTAAMLMIMGWNFSDLVDDTMISVLATFLSRILLLFLIKLMDKYWGNKNLFLPKEFWIILSSIFFIGFGTIFLVFYMMSIDDPNINNQVLIFLSIYIFFSSAIIFFFFEKTSQYFQFKNKAEMLENQILMEQNHLNQVKKLNERINIIRHDMKNHILCLQALLEKDESTSANAYASSILEQIQNNQLKYNTGNVALDALLNTKYINITEKNIHYNEELRIQSPIYISDIDICMVIANGLDNAIEACNHIENPKDQSISFEMEVNEDVVMVHIKNTYSVNPRRIRGLFQTSKSNTQNHGYGIQIINQIAIQNKGTFDVFFDDTYFSVSIILENQFNPCQK